MAERKVVMPGARTPMVNSDGKIDPTWYRFLFDLHERTGGGATDKVEVAADGAEGAQAAADTAQTAATTAQTAAATAQAAADSASSGVSSVSTNLTTLRSAVDGDGSTLGFYSSTPVAKPTVTGSTGGNTALQNTLSALDTLGLLTDSTT